MHFFLIFCLIFSAQFAHAVPKEESEEIVIRLATENQLIPIYLSKFVSETSELPSSYLLELEKILSFDLNHNGMTYTILQNSEREKLANQLSLSGSIKGKEWKSLSAFYVIQVIAKKEQKLSVSMLAANGDTKKSIDNISLTGKISQDRKQIHQLADAIHKALFGTNGIATTRILYTVRKDSGQHKLSEIWEADYDGENARLLVSEGYNIAPSYVPAKSGFRSGNFMFVSYKTGQPKFYIASLQCPEQSRRLSLLAGNQLMPTISKQRNRLAFISDVTGNPDLFIQSFSPEEGLQGKPRQIFSSRKATQGSPTFSPEGTQIAFVSNKDGAPRIYLLEIPSEGTLLKDLKPQLLSKHSSEASAPTWSPDGSKLAYCAMANGVRQIWIYDFNANEERQLTQGSMHKENPTWAPNSLTLMYNTSQPGQCELYLININQPKATKITSGVGEKRFPNWEPA